MLILTTGTFGQLLDLPWPNLLQEIDALLDAREGFQALEAMPVYPVSRTPFRTLNYAASFLRLKPALGTCLRPTVHERKVVAVSLLYPPAIAKACVGYHMFVSSKPWL